MTLDADGPARVFLLGGRPFGERLVMWWNFVGRDHDEIVAARADWQAADAARFAPVDHPVPPLPAPGLPTTRLLPRG